MILTRLLPATDVNWSTSSIDAIGRHSAAKRTAFNRILLARVDLVRLTVFSAIELCVHVMAAVAKFTIAVIELPACLVVKGLSPRVAFKEARAHAVRSVKLAVAVLCAPLAGLVNPLWSISLYQQLALVNEPQGRFGQVINSICSVARNPLLLGTLLVGGALVSRRYFAVRPRSPKVIFSPIVDGLMSFFGFGALFAAGAWMGPPTSTAPTQPDPETTRSKQQSGGGDGVSKFMQS